MKRKRSFNCEYWLNIKTTIISEQPIVVYILQQAQKCCPHKSAAWAGQPYPPSLAMPLIQVLSEISEPKWHHPLVMCLIPWNSPCVGAYLLSTPAAWSISITQAYWIWGDNQMKNMDYTLLKLPPDILLWVYENIKFTDWMKFLGFWCYSHLSTKIYNFYILIL